MPTCSRCETPWAHVHVTEGLALAGLIDTANFTEAGRTRGLYVHEACRLYDERRLDWDTLDPALLPYVEAYAQFCDEVETHPLADLWTHIEHPVADEAFGYVGTLDRASNDLIVDIKTGPAAWWVAVQVAAYRRCLQDAHRRAQYVLELRDDATYRFTATKELSGLTDRDAEKLWLNVVAVARAIKARR